MRTDGFAAVFNDTGTGHLEPLGRRGIAAFYEHADSARIGEARSSYESIISAVSDTAARLGAEPGQKAAEVLERLVTERANIIPNEPTDRR